MTERERERKLQEKAQVKKKLIEKMKIKSEKRKKTELEEEIGRRWGMLQWTHEFLLLNNERWEQVRAGRIKEEGRKLEEWDRMKRMEKIRRINQLVSLRLPTILSY